MYSKAHKPQLRDCKEVYIACRGGKLILLKLYLYCMTKEEKDDDHGGR